jgi:hypothetical protein
MKALLLVASLALAASSPSAWPQASAQRPARAFPDTLSQAQIDAGMKVLKPKADACAANVPGTHGKVEVAVKVGGAGEVQSASIASNAGVAPAVASCIAMAARSVMFAPTKDGASISYAFTFQSREPR